MTDIKKHFIYTAPYEHERCPYCGCLDCPCELPAPEQPKELGESSINTKYEIRE